MKTLRTLLISSTLMMAVASSAAFADAPRAHGPFHGIELSSEQKAQMRSIHEAFYADVKKHRGDGADRMKNHGDKPQRGDKKARPEQAANEKSEKKMHQPVNRHMPPRVNPELRPLIEAERFDEVAVRAVLEQQHKRLIDAQVKHAKLQHDLYNVLTQEQKDILAAQKEAGSHERKPQEPLIRK